MNLGEFKAAIDSHLFVGKTGFTSVPLFNDAIVYANAVYFKRNTGIDELPEQAPQMFWQKTRNITDNCSPFVVSHDGIELPLLNVSSSGYMPKPADMYLFSSMKWPEIVNGKIVGYRDITDMPDELFTARETSVRKAPTMNSIVSTVRNNQMCFLPKNVGRISLTYLRKPATPFFDYKIVGNLPKYLPPGSTHDGTNLPIGTPSRSVEFEWPEKCHTPDLFGLILDFVSSPMNNRNSAAKAQEIKTLGA